MKSLAENVITFCRCLEKHFHAHLAKITEEDIHAGAIVTEGSYLKRIASKATGEH